MRHEKESLDWVQLESLLKTMTLKEIANYYSTSLTNISIITTEIFSNKKLNRPVEKVGSWMESKERKSFKELRPDKWKELKETNLYKKLMYGRNENRLEKI